MREVAGGVIVLEDGVVVTIDEVVDLGGRNVLPDLIGIDVNANLVQESGESGNNIA